MGVLAGVTRVACQVFDLGGGTFDVSVLEVGGGIIEVREGRRKSAGEA